VDQPSNLPKVCINGIDQTITFSPNLPHDHIKKAIVSPMFTEWVDSISPKLRITTIDFQSVDLFKPPVGFIKIKTNVVDAATEHGLPNIVHLRSNTVCVLVVLVSEETGAEYAVLAVQARLPTGQPDFVEVLAGCLDDSGDFAGSASHELYQESGGFLVVERGDLIDLGKTVGLHQPIFLSPGGSSEAMRFYLCRKVVPDAFITSLQGKATGVLEENEFIVLKVVPIDDLLTIPDAKTIIALTFYREYLKRNP
jgi:hypothetical protein